ncbi:MAG TPA: DUF6612 family protein [Cerasibacillus sp.]|uniref:DUF6612 family protein n=1 Tax=Cerasibacillus sp. TaxID=2498711 RepID=UPI002F3F9B73
MKKWMTLFVAIALAFTLSACQENAEEVYNKALEASKELKSAEVDLDIKQTIGIPSEDMTMDISSKMDVKMTTDPLTMYQKGTIDMGDLLPIAMEMESYVTEDAMYMYESMSDTWMKMDSVLSEEMLNQQQDPAEQLKLLEEFAKDFTFEKDDNAFVLKLEADGEKLKDNMDELIKQYMPQEIMQALGEETFKDMDISKLNYEIFIDKKTYHLNKLNVDMDMKIKADGEEMNISQKVNAEYKNINGVDPIKVPQDVIDNAQEMGF